MAKEPVVVPEESFVKVIITEKFYSRVAFSEAALFAEDRPDAALKAWSAIEMRRGQSANVRATTTVLSNAVDLEEKYIIALGFRALIEAGMVIVDEASVGEKLTNDHFEQFWKAYPFRLGDNQKPIRVGKQNAKREFKKYIRTEEDFALLLNACAHYAQATKFRKDPERFLRNEVWKEFINEDIGTAVEKLPEVNPSPANVIDVQKQREDVWKRVANNNDR